MTEPDFVTSTRASYDTMASDYTEIYRHALATTPMDKAMLAMFAEQVEGPVADVGCGPGRITGHLRALGMDVFGIDLSPQMIAIARREHPAIRFEEGSILALDLPDGGLSGLVSWYSIIHTPIERLHEVFEEFHRVLAPGGLATLAFQVGDEPTHYDDAWGKPVSLTFRRNQPDHVADLLAKAGFDVRARATREPDEQEKTPQAYLLARKPA